MGGLFAGLGKAAAPFSKGAFFKDGRYLVEIRRVVQGDSQQGKGPFVAVEVVILDVLVGYDGSNKEGEALSWVVMLRQQSALSNLKGFFGAACGIHPEALFFEHPQAAQLKAANPGVATMQVVNVGDAPPAGWWDVTSREWEGAAERVVAGDGSALAGTRLVATAKTVQTRKGTPFTAMSWEQAPDDAS